MEPGENSTPDDGPPCVVTWMTSAYRQHSIVAIDGDDAPAAVRRWTVNGVKRGGGVSVLVVAEVRYAGGRGVTHCGVAVKGWSTVVD